MSVIRVKSLQWGLSLAFAVLPLMALSSAARAQSIQVDTESQPQSSPRLQRYQRKYISFFYPQDYALNEKLSSSFASDFPRFDYHLTSTSLGVFRTGSRLSGGQCRRDCGGQDSCRSALW